MDQFIAQHADAIEGTLSCFDRLIFRGYLPFFNGYAAYSNHHDRSVRPILITRSADRDRSSERSDATRLSSLYDLLAR